MTWYERWQNTAPTLGRRPLFPTPGICGGSSVLTPKISVLIIIALGMLALWTFFHHLGEGSLYDWDEATYGQVAREIVQRGDWLTLSHNGREFFDKPPLVFWLMALALKMVNPPELAIRLVPALCGLLT